MPTRRVHLKFDQYLWEHGVILDDTYGDSVHKRLDKGLSKYGPDHQFMDYYHTEEGIRYWLDNMPETMSQDRKTDYMRIALGHMVLDEMAYRRPDLNEDDLIKAAYRSFIQRGYHRKYYKALG